jgi:hypothetical protein
MVIALKQGGRMTNALPDGRLAQGEFRVGHVFSLTWSIFSRNFFKFTIISAVTFLPFVPLIVFLRRFAPADLAASANVLVMWLLVGAAAAIFLSLFCQAILLHAAFQDMSGRSGNLAESAKVALGRLLPIIGIGLIGVVVMIVYIIALGFVVAAIAGSLQSPGFAALAFLLGIIPGVMIYLMWVVAIPACVVERLGPFRSLGRSQALTKGHRWKIFGQQLMLLIAGLVLGLLIGVVLNVLGRALGPGATLTTIVNLIVNLVWYAGWIAFGIMILVVTYHDLRVAKEGIGSEQIAAVFE